MIRPFKRTKEEAQTHEPPSQVSVLPIPGYLSVARKIDFNRMKNCYSVEYTLTQRNGIEGLSSCHLQACAFQNQNTSRECTSRIGYESRPPVEPAFTMLHLPKKRFTKRYNGQNNALLSVGSVFTHLSFTMSVTVAKMNFRGGQNSSNSSGTASFLPSEVGR